MNAQAAQNVLEAKTSLLEKMGRARKLLDLISHIGDKFGGVSYLCHFIQQRELNK